MNFFKQKKKRDKGDDLMWNNYCYIDCSRVYFLLKKDPLIKLVGFCFIW